MVRTAQARFLVTTPARAGQHDLTIDGPTVFVDAPDAPAPLRPLSPRSLAYVSHTSGSSGPPNAVLLEHRGVTNYLRFIVDDYQLGPDTVVLQLAPFGYDASIRDTFAPLVAGGQVVLVPRSTLLRAGEFVAALRRWG